MKQSIMFSIVEIILCLSYLSYICCMRKKFLFLVIVGIIGLGGMCLMASRVVMRSMQNQN